MESKARIIRALAVGVTGSLFIWVAAPYNNFYLNNSFISDTYFPVSAVLFMLVILLAVNPVLRLLGRGWMLNGRELALVFAMLLGAAVVPSQGLLRMLPWSIASSNVSINENRQLAEAFEQTGMSHALFPDPVGYDKLTPVSEQLLDELDPDASIPWAAWWPVLRTWGPFLFACWLLMVGVGLVLYPEWKERERLQFPLVDVYRTLLPEEQGSGRMLPAVFYNRLFWIAAGTVMLLYALQGMRHHTGGNFPSIPLGWHLSSLFNESPWRYLNWHIKNVDQIYFVLVGMTFFMPNRVGFSIWFTVIAYGVYIMIGQAYFQPFRTGFVTDHRNGAMIMVTLLVLYLSWRHWVHVGRLMLRRTTDEAEHFLKMSGWMVAAGALGMLIWLVWVGVPVWWAGFFVLLGFMVSVLIARIVAETGLPFVRITGLEPGYFMAMFPARWLTGAAVYMAGFITMIFPFGSRVSAAVMISQAAGIDKQAGPKYQLRLGYLMIGLLVLGLLVAGAVHLNMGYSHSQTIDGASSVLNSWGSSRMNATHRELIRFSNDNWPGVSGRMTNLMVGMVLAAFLQIMCMRNAAWPVHPIGLLLIGHFYANIAWASILFGWLLKVTTIYYGGAHAFRKAKPLFLGLIMGEIFSAVIWTGVPISLLWLGYDPRDVGHIQILPK